MRRFYNILASLLTVVFAVSCVQTEEPAEKLPIVIRDGLVELSDQGFGVYYGDRDYNQVGVYSIVLSDAVCFRDGYGAPYLDSEGEMIVLEIYAELQDADAPVMFKEGVYPVSDDKTLVPRVNLSTSYVKRLVGMTQYTFSIVSGSVSVKRNIEAGGYDLVTQDLKITNGTEIYEVQYSYTGSFAFEEWSKIAAESQGISSDIVDMPFTDVSGVYYGNLFGEGTGNYIIQLSTDGFMEDETGKVPGVALIMNMFSDLVSTDVEDVYLPEGTYTVYPSYNAKEFSMLYGFNMDGVPFGTYLAQVDKAAAQSLEYIGNGTVDVSYETKGNVQICCLEYELLTSTRKVKGKWVGELKFDNQAEESGRVVLSTLKDDVECDLYRVEKGDLSHIETLKTTPQPSVDIAEAWQLSLAPREWTDEEKKLPWEERIQAWNPNGDVMILEFIVPIDSKGNIAPEINTEYSYQIQPNLSMEDQLYDLSVSNMGRPYDDIFYEPDWKEKYTYMTGVDARRGFTWDGYFRGNWYLHFEEGSYQAMDQHAPAVKGTVKVTRLTEPVLATGGGRQAEFKFVWDLYDDAEASNNITGEWTGPVTVHTSAEL